MLLRLQQSLKYSLRTISSFCTVKKEKTGPKSKLLFLQLSPNYKSAYLG